MFCSLTAPNEKDQYFEYYSLIGQAGLFVIIVDPINKGLTEPGGPFYKCLFSNSQLCSG